MKIFLPKNITKLGISILTMGMVILPMLILMIACQNDENPLSGDKPSFTNTLKGKALFPDAEKNGGVYAQDSILVRVKGENSEWNAASLIEGIIEDSFLMNGDTYCKVLLPNKMNVNEALSYYNENPAIVYAEPEYIYQPTFVPNDPLLEVQQYAPQITNALKAWDIEQGKDYVTLAVVDTGVHYHREFRDRMIEGFDCVQYLPIPPGQSSDDNGHGSHCAGIAAAQGNNRFGVAGVAWNVKIMPLKVCTEYGCFSYAIQRGIRHAADHQNGQKMVLTMSIGGAGYTQLTADVVAYAQSKDLIVVVAAGNEGEYHQNYPVSYPGVLGVGCSNARDTVVDFSSRGKQVDVVAPGYDILSVLTHTFDQYMIISGTSMACPFVAGFACLIRSANPDLKNWQVFDIITQTADPIEGADPYTWNPVAGWGRVNVGNGVEVAANIKKNPSDPYEWVWHDKEGKKNILGVNYRKYNDPGFRLGSVHVKLKIAADNIVDGPNNNVGAPIISQDIMLMTPDETEMVEINQTSDGSSTPDFETGMGALSPGECYFNFVPEGDYILKTVLRDTNEIKKPITIVANEMLEVELDVSIPQKMVNYTISAFPPYNNKSLVLGRKQDAEAPSACRPYLILWDEGETDTIQIGRYIDADIDSNSEYYSWPKTRLLGPIGRRYIVQMRTIPVYGYNDRPDLNVGYYGMLITNDNTAPSAYKIPDDWVGMSKYSNQISASGKRVLWKDPESTWWLTAKGEFYDSKTNGWVDLNASPQTTPEIINKDEVVFGYLHENDNDFWILDLKN